MISTMTNPETFSVQVRQCAERIAESGSAALAGLYDLTAQRLVRFAVTITRNQHDAEDAVQAALVRVAVAPCLLDQAEYPWPYLLRMVRNESLVIVRKRRPIASLHSLIDLFTRRTVDELEVEDTYRAIWTALRQLPTEQSQVVVLKIWEEMTFGQVAEVLEITPSTAASRYRYGLAKLSQQLGHCVSEKQDV